jgi:hypothetical protein
MEESFNLHQTVLAVQQAVIGVVCHMIFDAAIHGLAMALILGGIGLTLKLRQNRFGQPLINVCRRLSFVCLLLASPGALTLIFQGHLPPSGVYNVNSIGFIIFWSLICLHFSAEEMNYCFFIKSPETNSQASLLKTSDEVKV